MFLTQTQSIAYFELQQLKRQLDEVGRQKAGKVPRVATKKMPLNQVIEMKPTN